MTNLHRDIDVRDRPDGARDKSLGDLFSELSRDVSALARDEVELAKTELREEAKRAGKAAGMYGAAGLTGYLSLLMLSFAAAWGLASVIPAGFAFLIIAVVYGATAAFLFVRGRDQMQKLNPTPEETIETLKEDARWARAQLK